MNAPDSKKLVPLDRIQFDAETGETTNRGNAIDAQPSRLQRHAVKQACEDEIEDACFRANVVLHGRDRALELWRVANQ